MTDYKLLHTLRMMAATQGTHSGEGAGGREAGGRLAELAADRIEELEAKLEKVTDVALRLYYGSGVVTGDMHATLVELAWKQYGGKDD